MFFEVCYGTSPQRKKSPGQNGNACQRVRRNRKTARRALHRRRRRTNAERRRPIILKIGVQRITTAGSAHFVERFSRTFKYMINQQVKELHRKKRLVRKTTPIDPDQIQWHLLAPTILAVYSNKNKRRITKLTPADARKPAAKQTQKLRWKLQQQGEDDFQH